jgi:hypothetical protein
MGKVLEGSGRAILNFRVGHRLESQGKMTRNVNEDNR